MIGKSFEEFNRFFMMCMTSPRWLRLAWPVHCNVLRVTLHERFPVFTIPSVVSCLHKSQVFFNTHSENSPRGLRLFCGSVIIGILRAASPRLCKVRPTFCFTFPAISSL